MKDVIAVLKEQRAEHLDNVARIDKAIAALGGGKPGRSASSAAAEKSARKRRPMTDEARKAVSERMRNYWAERRKQGDGGEGGGGGNGGDSSDGGDGSAEANE